MEGELSRVELILALAAASEEFRRDLVEKRAGALKQLHDHAELGPSEAALLEAPSRDELEAMIAAIRPPEGMSIHELGMALIRALCEPPPQPSMAEGPSLHEPIACTGIRPDLVEPEPRPPWWKRIFRRGG